MPIKDYYVYIATNASRTLYVGVTNDLMRRMHEHKEGIIPGFTRRYRINRLVYYEGTSSIESAIRREKQLKGLLRRKKVALIEKTNSQWHDLYSSWL